MEPRHEDALRRIYEADRNWRESGESPREFEMLFFGGRDEIQHPAWKPSWPNPSDETVNDLAELEFLSVDSNLAGTPFSLTMKGREEAARLLDPLQVPSVDREGSRDSRRVAVMHGRDMEATRWMRRWLRSVDLDPLEWSDLVDLTGKGTPYNGEAVEAAFGAAQAVIVLFTPDEIGVLHPGLGSGDDDGAQPRLNVVLEAGMALQSEPRRTILVQIGSTRGISNLAGRNTVRLDGGMRGLNDLARRLERAGCPVSKSNDEWFETDQLGGLGALRRKSDRGELDSRPPGGIDAVAPGDSSYRVFRARGERIESRMHNGKLWSGWWEVGSVDEEPIGLAAASMGGGHAEVYVLLPRGEVMHNWRGDDEEWEPEFRSLGQPFGGERVRRIAAGSKGERHAEVFVESTSGEIAHIWWHRGWRRNGDVDSSLGDGWWRF